MSEDPSFPALTPADAPSSGTRRRRRRVTVSGTGPEDPEKSSRAAVIAFVGMALLGLWGMFAVMAPLAVLHGTVWIGLGLLLLLVPPRVRVGWIWILAGALVLGGCLLSLLPADWVGKPAWRTAVEALGLATGGQVTTQPQVTLTLWAGLAVSVLAAWFLLGHRIPDAAFLPLALLMAWGIAGYAVVSMLVYQNPVPWVWDPVEDFGLYGNRNHTATVLVMGVLTALGGLMEAVRGKRGGAAGLAALALAVCLWALLGFSTSRAGVVLLALGLLGWVAGLGLGRTRYFSKRVGLTLLGFVLVGGAIFWWTDNALRSRLEKSWANMEQVKLPTQAQPGSSSDSPSEGAPKDQTSEFRNLVYQDTAEMIRHEPVTGVGLGEFSYVFPQYREAAAVHARMWHPESNWLMLAAEAGRPTAAVLALAVAGLFYSAFRAGRQHRGWPLALATLLAAAVVPVHGLFDVPGNHVGIAWPALWLLALNFRRGDRPDTSYGILGRALFRVAGGLVLAGGAWLCWTGGPANGLPGPLKPGGPIDQINALYNRDIAEKTDPAAHPPELKPDGTPVDQLEVAQTVVKAALQSAPLDPELHYLRGLLSVNFTDETAIADQAFAVERLLEPDWMQIPYRQGLAWLTVDPARTIPLWQEALRRAEAAHRTHPGMYWSPETLRGQMKSAAKDHPEVLAKIGG